MKTARIVHEPGDGTATTWTITAGYDDGPDQVYTLTTAQGLNAVVSFDTLTIERDATDVSPVILTKSCTIYLRDTLQYFPEVSQISPLTFGVWAFFWCWLAFKLAS